MTGLQVGVLGSFEARRDGQTVSVTARRNRVLLAVLASQPNRIVPLERLIAALWDEDPPRTARAQIHICVSALRTALGDPDSIQTHPVGYALRIADEDVDCRLFERLLDEVKTVDATADPERALRLLDRALDLWRGPAFHGLSGPVLESAAVWLEQRRIVAIEERMEIRLRLGREDPDEIAELCARYPLRERLHAFLMISLYRSGRQADALAAYQNVRGVLVEELGIEPGRELQAIEQSILNQDSTLDLARMRGAGIHRIVLTPHQLTGAASDFTGREDSVDRLCAELVTINGLGARGTPIALITGMCGIGKTALAVQAAHRMIDRFPDGQLFARLDGSTTRPAEPADILDRFLRGLGVDAREIPDDVDSRAEMMRSLLGGKHVLIFLDDAASEAQVTPLLPGLPGCAVVVTSRRRLVGIPGVFQFELGTLPDADAHALLERIVSDDRLREDPEAVKEIVRCCGGLPFAIRIAGSRLASHPHWGAAELVRRMADEEQRLDQLVHGGLGVRALLAVAYETLSDRARRVFRLLGLLSVPDFTDWNAAAAAGVPLDKVAPLLDELVDSRLLDVEPRQTGRVRYRFHDLVRLYAAERASLEDSLEEQARAVDDVLDGCLALTRESHRRCYGGDFVTLGDPLRSQVFGREELDKLLHDPLAWYSEERSVVLALVAQAANSGRHRAAWNIAVGAVVFFEALGCFDDWRTTHELALAVTQRYGNTRGEASVLCSLGSLGVARGDGSVDGGLLRSLRLFSELDDTLGRALTLRNLAHFDRVHGSYDSAFGRYREALAGFQAAGDPVGEAHALSGLAQTYLEADDLQSAELFSFESLRLAQAISNRRLESQALYRLGEVLAARGDFASAHGHLAKALDIVQAADDQIGQAYVLTSMASVLVDLNELMAAESVLDEIAVLCDILADGHLRGRAILTRARVHQARGNYATAESLILSAAAIFSDKGGAVWHGRALKAISDLRRRAMPGQVR